MSSIPHRSDGGRGILRLIVPASLLLALLVPGARAGEVTDEQCMICHEDLQKKLPDGSVRDLRVDLGRYERSVHGRLGLGCVVCHTDVKTVRHPRKLAPVDCARCHRDVKRIYLGSVHAQVNEKAGGKVAASCTSCHGTHDILPASDPASSVNHHNLARTCIRCHEDQALIDRREKMPGAEVIQSYVLSVHGQSNEKDAGSQAATCSNCHGGHDIRRPRDPEASVSRRHVAQTCGKCHRDVLEVYYGSVHGRLAKQGNPDVPVCTDCHGEHRIRSPEDRRSTVSRFHIAETCARCHENPEIVKKYRIPIASPATFYRNSVHGIEVMKNQNGNAAACQDCHGHHSILGGDDPRSRVNRHHIPETCGNCHQHEEIKARYERSIHGQAFREGVTEAPVCTDCHGEHRILSHLDPNAPTYSTRIAKEVCGRCHGSLVVTRKYGLSAERVQTYYESYHGLASQLGDTTVANCASCHGVHLILPRDDPDSTINPRNLRKTCGRCHPGATADFVKGLVHVSRKSRRGENAVLWWIRRIYIALIALTIGGMLLHNFVIIGRHVREKYRAQKGLPYVRRFPTTALVQHLLIMVTFILLVLTGFSLAYPQSLFSRMVSTYLGLGEHTRALVHRIAGVGLGLTMLWHIGVMIFTKRGRRELRSILFRLEDVGDAFRNIGYHMGLCRRKPRFDRFDYSEKMEYWALLWGTLVMIVTGLVMWFPVRVTALFGLSKVWIDAATTIHFYEAWLATLAIAIWHFFFVIFHPEEYPMAMSWLTGRLPVESMEERHPKELERLERAGEVIHPEEEE